jgi:hypothetical protein
LRSGVGQPHRGHRARHPRPHFSAPPAYHRLPTTGGWRRAEYAGGSCLSGERQALSAPSLKTICRWSDKAERAHIAARQFVECASYKSMMSMARFQCAPVLQRPDRAAFNVLSQYGVRSVYDSAAINAGALFGWRIGRVTRAPRCAFSVAVPARIAARCEGRAPHPDGHQRGFAGRGPPVAQDCRAQ